MFLVVVDDSVTRAELLSQISGNLASRAKNKNITKLSRSDEACAKSGQTSRKKFASHTTKPAVCQSLTELDSDAEISSSSSTRPSLRSHDSARYGILRRIHGGEMELSNGNRNTGSDNDVVHEGLFVGERRRKLEDYGNIRQPRPKRKRSCEILKEKLKQSQNGDDGQQLEVSGAHLLVTGRLDNGDVDKICQTNESAGRLFSDSSVRAGMDNVRRSRNQRQTVSSLKCHGHFKNIDDDDSDSIENDSFSDEMSDTSECDSRKLKNSSDTPECDIRKRKNSSDIPEYGVRKLKNSSDIPEYGVRKLKSLGDLSEFSAKRLKKFEEDRKVSKGEALECRSKKDKYKKSVKNESSSFSKCGAVQAELKHTLQDLAGPGQSLDPNCSSIGCDVVSTMKQESCSGPAVLAGSDSLCLGRLFENGEAETVGSVSYEPIKSHGQSHAVAALVEVEKIPDWMYVAIDCEMVGVGLKGKHSVLARCSIVDYDGSVLYDQYVRPQEAITDYRTPWSGIRPVHMRTAVPIVQALKDIKERLAHKIVIGHAVYHDFKVLGIQPDHHFVRDTAQCKKLVEMAGLQGRGNGLKKLSQALLGRSIQTGHSGHCSVEDARATLDLFKLVHHSWEPDLYTTWSKKCANIAHKVAAFIEAGTRHRDLTSSEDFFHDKFWPSHVTD